MCFWFFKRKNWSAFRLVKFLQKMFDESLKEEND